MKIRFTYHALAQALARDIPEWSIAEAIRHPDETTPAPGGATLYRKQTGDGILEVVCKLGKTKNEQLVLTAYYQ